jgi:MATE family multidrug resistance protein
VNWILVFGHFGAPALGAEGSGWATTSARVYLLLFVVAYVARHERRSGVSLALYWAFDTTRMRTLLRLGVPAALQMLLEVGVFAMATLLAGRLSAVQLAAHQIALSAAAFAFMVPLGISSAAAVRVGYAMGRIDGAGAARAGWTALFLAVAFMSCSAITFVAVPRAIIRVFTTDAVVIETGTALLGIAAIFALFDGLQVVATGVLRGAGDTRSPMLASLVGYWIIGLPLGYAMCFRHGFGVVGLWIGLSAGLITVAIALMAVWSVRSRELLRERRIVAAA